MMKQTRRIFALVIVLLLAAPLSAEIYRVVDKDGNVTYTDQPPSDGSAPLDLPDLSVIQTERPAVPEAPVDATATPGQDEGSELTTAQLRKMYRDFEISQPQNEETFWGTANQVVVSWGSREPLQPGMTVTLYVDGVPVDVAGQGSMTLRLDRGEHTVRAELFNGGRRPLVTTKTVTFFVKQASIGQNRITPSPVRGAGPETGSRVG